jgi:tRNA(Ile)-lysidine synthase
LPPRNVRATAADDVARLPVTPDEADLLFEGFACYRHVAIAVSGGSDSVALMALARAWSQRRGGPRLTALTVDHGLRPEATAEAVAVAAWAEGMGLAHRTLTWEGPKPAHGIQEAARQARYGLMGEWCQANGADALALGHTLEDQAETVLMRLARGSGVDGLSGMAGVSQLDGIALLRPLLGLRKSRLRATLEALEQPWIEDPSNADERFERVRVRNALAILEDLGMTAEAIGRSAGRLGSARAALDEATAQAMADGVTCFDAGFVSVNLDRFAATGAEIGARLLARCLQAVGGRAHPPGHDALARLGRHLRTGEGSSWTLGGCAIRRRRARALICRESGRRAPEPAAIGRNAPTLWDGRFRIAVAGSRPSGLVIRPLDVAGWTQVVARDRRQRSLPAYLGRSLVSVWSGDRLVSVPHLEPSRTGPVVAEFLGRGLLAGVRRQRLIDAGVTANLPARPIIAATIEDE